MVLGVILCTLFFVLFLYDWYTKTRIPHGFPDGPFGYPLVGYPALGKQHLLPAFEELHEEYGPVFSVNLGPQKRTVVVGDYDVIKDLFKMDALSVRPPMMQWANQYFRYGNGKDSRGLLFSEGEEWKEQRRFTLKVLKDFGFGKSSMEGLIHDEIVGFNHSLAKDVGKPISLRHRFNISVINALWTLISGKRLPTDDPELMKLVHAIDEMTIEAGRRKPIDAFPWLRHIAPKASGWKQSSDSMVGMVDFIESTMHPHISSYNAEDPPNDFIEAYLQQVSESSPGSSFHGTKGIQSMRSTLIDLMFAGTETTSTVLNWSVLLMIKYPEIQSKVQDELDSVCGRERLPCLADRGDLHFTEAVIHEIMRFTCIAPFGVPHYTREQVKTSDGKITISAGTNVFPNFYHIMNNPKVFPNPRNFDPQRFIDHQNKFVKHEHNIVFGIGKRDCLGKSLAQVQFYLFFTGILHQFKFRSVIAKEKLTLEPHWGFTLTTQPFEVVTEKRE